MISVVIPCYNEAEVLHLTCETVMAAAHDWGESYELILVDDGSQDETWDLIAEWANRDTRVRGVRLSRNFGHQAALGAGLEEAEGEAVVVLDADLQDPPALVTEMIAHWRAGAEVVYAQRNCRQGETVFKRVTGNLFYRLLDRINQVTIPRDTGDFVLLDAQVVRHLLNFQEHALFWRGLRCWTGFRHVAVHFDRPPRAKGETKYTLAKLMQLATNGLFSFSYLPLRLGLYLGAGLLGLTAIATAIASAAWAVWGNFVLSPILLAVLAIGGAAIPLLGRDGGSTSTGSTTKCVIVPDGLSEKPSVPNLLPPGKVFRPAKPARLIYIK